MNVADTASKQEAARFLIDAARCAPSVHNTQPWWFGTRGSTVTLHADSDRRLQVADPDGREMLISCGAALHTPPCGPAPRPQPADTDAVRPRAPWADRGRDGGADPASRRRRTPDV